MRKVAIFVEGQGELIFVRQLIVKLFDQNNISFECFELRSSFTPISVPYQFTSPNASIYFRIINVGNDERLLSAILERQKKLVESGFEILGIRDMYSRAYKKQSQEINSDVNELFIKIINDQIVKQTQNVDKIHIFFAIMELEAWFLSMPNLFKKLSPKLTPEFIHSKLGFNLTTIDPEVVFFNPAQDLDQVFRLIGERYKKSWDEMEKIAILIEDEDILAVTDSTKCKSFTAFVSKLIEMK